MAKYIGSPADGKYPSEDEVIKRLEKDFNDSCRIYRNRPTVIGSEYDACVLYPSKGIFLFEVKAWLPENIVGVCDDSVYIKGDDKPHNPTNQAKDYRIALTEEIEDRFGVAPFIHSFVWLINFTEKDLKETGLDSICKVEDTFLKEDFDSMRSFVSKIRNCWNKLESSAEYWANFTPELMARVEKKIYGDFNGENQPTFEKINPKGKSENPLENPENEIINKLSEYFDDSCQVDQYSWPEGICTKYDFRAYVVHPDRCIFLFEVKTWLPEDILKVTNGDTIIVRGINDPQNPIKQARDHGFTLTDKIKNQLGRAPFIQPFVWLPNFTKKQLIEMGIEPICKYEVTFLKEDFESRESFVTKFNKCFARMERKANYSAEDFPPELMKHAEKIINDFCGQDTQASGESSDYKESYLDPEVGDENKGNSGTDISTDAEHTEVTNHKEEDQQPNSADELYSILAYVPHDENLNQNLQKLSDAYSNGAKLFLLIDGEHPEDLQVIRDRINSVLKEKNLSYDGRKLNICTKGDERVKVKEDGNFEAYNCFTYFVDVNEMFKDDGKSKGYFEIINGEICKESLDGYHEKFKKILDNVNEDRNCNFNLEQYEIEHWDIKQNIVVRAGAGTGKTHVMIARIAYLCFTQRDHLEDMIENIVMLTFTEAAATQMQDKIKEYFYNYFLLSGKSEYLAFISQIEKMQISTIHAYAKKMVNQLGFELGYGTDVSIASSSYQLKQIIEKKVDSYIKDALNEYGNESENEFLDSLNMQIYQINDAIYEIISQLRNQSVNVADLNWDNFWEHFPPDKKPKELHRLIAEVVPEVEKEDTTNNREENRIQLGNLMSVLSACVRDEKNKRRISDMRTGGQRFMFVDEFQDTDNVQIDTLKAIAGALEYTLFVVGDVKQCIYRFRGATEDAFKRLRQDENGNKWKEFSLRKNYRTDCHLLKQFDRSFENMGRENVGLLNYKEDDQLKGVRHYNDKIPVDSFYHRICVEGKSQEDRMKALFGEITRLKKMNSREIAILVRENWQADVIRREGKKRGVEILTNTSGDLYESEPALDMLKLANALLHFDEPDYLYALASSNFIPGSISKANLYLVRGSKQEIVKRLTSVIDESIKIDGLEDWAGWDDIIKSLRSEPILQVLRRIYQIFKPWINYAPYNDQDEDKERKKVQQINYRLNVDLLFEELIRSTNTDSLSVHALVDFLFRNIIAHTNVDSRAVNIADQNMQYEYDKGEKPEESKKPVEPVIKCLTVHKAKGLEYDAVILPYCSADMGKMKDNHVNVSVEGDSSTVKIGYKLKDSTHNDFYEDEVEINEQKKEEARILYVAMTRAKQWFSWIALKNNTGDRWQDFILGADENVL